MTSSAFDALLARLNDRSAIVGVVGLGYVGLPLAAAVGRAGGFFYSRLRHRSGKAAVSELKGPLLHSGRTQ